MNEFGRCYFSFSCVPPSLSLSLSPSYKCTYLSLNLILLSPGTSAYSLSTYAAEVDKLKMNVGPYPVLETLIALRILLATTHKFVYVYFKWVAFSCFVVLVHLMICRHDFSSYFFQVWSVLFFSHSSSRRASCWWSGVISVFGGKHSSFSTSGKIYAWIGNYHLVLLGLVSVLVALNLLPNHKICCRCFGKFKCVITIMKFLLHFFFGTELVTLCMFIDCSDSLKSI